MNRFLVLGLLLTFSTFSSLAGPEKMIGTWKSNKGATVAHLKIHTALTRIQIEKISTILGKMVLVIDAETITSTHGDDKFTTKYKVLSETKNTITFEAENPQTRKIEKGVFEFDASGKGFWSSDDKIEGFKERFDKVVTN